MNAFYEAWQPCLGRVLRAAEVRLLDSENADSADVAGLCLRFGAPDAVRCLTCKPDRADWVLSVDAHEAPSASMLVVDGKDHLILASFVGKIHTAVQLFVDADGASKAMAFLFGKQAFALGVGRREWSAATGALTFEGFRGEALSLWTVVELNELLRQHPLRLGLEIGVA